MRALGPVVLMLVACGSTGLRDVAPGELLLSTSFKSVNQVAQVSVTLDIPSCPRLAELPRARANGVELALTGRSGWVETCAAWNRCETNCAPWTFAGQLPLASVAENQEIRFEVDDSTATLSLVTRATSSLAQRVVLPAGTLDSTNLTLRFDPGPTPAYLVDLIAAGKTTASFLSSGQSNVYVGSQPEAFGCSIGATMDPAELKVRCAPITGSPTVVASWLVPVTHVCVGAVCKEACTRRGAAQ